ncbi:aspartic proteinase-like protein 2 isoform X2 [Durio zibethinus]|uniref:Aspartic proteinase-like protein 2 isoform X2 n=1 Tax=Durio zibethinus TaxID=66656 RepID=A0A6P5YY09_DURZI|nr:aspartic proteinase-like protein 2 isoform X2 [Durio zibethinus]
MMDLRRLALAVVTVAVTVVGEFGCCFGNVVTFDVKHKFAGKGKNLSALRAHDIRRHGRLLSTVNVDLPLGGNGHPSETGLYFAKIGLGNPSKDHYVQVDTGSDILWVNCAECDKCPAKSDLGIELTLYNPKSSSTSSLVYCDQDFCTSTYDGPLPGCKPNLQCQYNVVYGDGSSTAGYFVKDTIQLQQVTGNLKTGSSNGTVIFGCGAKQSGELGSSSEALDGILGFGQANSSVISQLAAAGKVKRKFAHCLDNKDGGGIFTIGEVVSPKVNTTPMVPNHGDQKGTIVDSGTTLAYLPSTIYEPLMTKILSSQPALILHTVEDQFTCFRFGENVDDGFPVVKFHFKDSLILAVFPHEYLFQIREDAWCFGWQNSGMQSKDGKDMILLGDLVLSNKLVIYDIENQTIGWTEYNCSSSIKVKDKKSGTVYAVGAHDIGSASSMKFGGILTFLFILIALLHSSIA